MPGEKTCTKCDQVRAFSEFSKAPRGRYGLKASCKACDAMFHRAAHPPRPRKPNPKRRAAIDPSNEKTCRKCGETKPHFQFSLSRAATETTNAVYRSHCKVCQAERARGWYARNPERANENRRRFNLGKIYGITVVEYNELLRKQSGVCAICGQGEASADGRTGKRFRLSVDHCHTTGAIRGLLCQRCNRALGLLDDDPRLLRRAISYLLRGKEAHQGGE